MLWNQRKIMEMNAFGECLGVKESCRLKEALRRNLEENEERSLGEMGPLIPEKLKQFMERTSYEDLVEQYKQSQISWVHIEDSHYPKRLQEIYLPPQVLFYRGNFSLLKRICLGVVGARKHSSYATNVLQQLIPACVKHQMTIISGLARGVDGMAQEQTLYHSGKTVGVIGTGLDRFYPFEHKALQKSVAENGLLLSEYPRSSPGYRYHFPYRNRIIAGLCHGLLVVEAQENSGSLITANVALKENRSVFVVPGSIFSPYSKGTNALLRDGAIPVLESEDLLAELRYYE